MPSDDESKKSKKSSPVEKEQLEDALAREYSGHQEQLKNSRPSPERVAQIESSLIAAYKSVLEYREVPFIRFRDLGFDLDTYSAKITAEQARILAGYIKPFLPPTIAVPALVELDRYFWTDK